MRLAIMQPYFLPYIGYFQLIAAVDRLVLLDDVNYINRGWIARNRIPLNGQPFWITLPLIGASQNRLVREIEIMPDDGWKARMLRNVQQAYVGAPFARQMVPFFGDLIAGASGNLSAFLYDSLHRVAKVIGLETDIVPTSSVYPKDGLEGQDRILDICRRQAASLYVNLPGGKGLYDNEKFDAAGVTLRFLDPSLAELKVRNSLAEGPVLSILDLLMLNPPEAVLAAVRACRIVPSAQPTLPP
jgi:hypothetical protein